MKSGGGMSPEEARRQSLNECGGVEQTRERGREQEPGWWTGTLPQDMRYALRGFWRNPAFAIPVIITLALGIGATTAVFSVVDRILFRELPYAHAEHIVSVGLVQSLGQEEFMSGGFYFDWFDNQRPFEAISSLGDMLHACDLVEDNPQQLNCIPAQAGFLPLLGISPVIGRNFSPDEDRPNGPRVALISYGVWLDHYNHDPHILNRLINLDGKPTRIIGVLPKGFELPTVETPDVLLPMKLDRADQNNVNGGFGQPMRTFARLKSGVSIPQAKAEMEPLFLHTLQTFVPPPLRTGIHLSIRSLRDRETQGVQLAAWVLLCAVLAVLLITCANVAGLMMARSTAREREKAIRSALGASRGQLIRQSLTEALLLSLAGAAAGLALAEGLLRGFIAIAPASIPFLGKASLDLRVALFTVAISLLCGAFFGVAPALERPRSIALEARAGNFGRHAILRRGLVAGQIACSMILLSGAGLLVRSFQNIEEQNLGLRTKGVVTAQIALPQFRYNTGQEQMDFYLRAEAALRRMPGIRAVTITDSVPPGGWQSGFRLSDLATEDNPHPTPGEGGTVVSRSVTPDYFRALDIPVVRGRGFSEEDRTSTQSLVILSRLMATRLFPGRDPVGKSVRMIAIDPINGPRFTVVGVVDDVKNSGLTEQNKPEIYLLRRNVADDWSGRAPIIVIDSVLPADTVMPWVRSQMASLDPTVPVEIKTLNWTISSLASRPRFETALLGFFAFIGLVIAVVGLYGVIAFLATQRTKEIGIRMALGASRLDILRLILREGVLLVALGGAVGLVAAFALSRLLKSLLYGVSPHDPLSFVTVTFLLALVALAATLIPARTAMKVEPVKALRYE
ncbi:ABC transporter permease [Granulicella sp. L60]|uniref:ABC transporter permease n=1 Tax=Granulicella sp. L60 TaxID=1641866 RepID=UPI0020B15506|nr:ABC transporter permease [Granulicella sp. L60]